MRAFVRLLVPVAAIGWATPSQATLIMEPVINSVPGSGPSADSAPLYDPGFVNPANGEHPFLANKPGEIDTVSIGFPTDPDLLTNAVWNNTAYNLTSLKLSIIGTALHPTGEEGSWLIIPDPNVDAFFGDANGEAKLGCPTSFHPLSYQTVAKRSRYREG